MFPKNKFDLFKTKHGYHVKIRKKVTLLENLYSRYLIGDDPRRIYAGVKRFITTNDPRDFDVLFDIKNGYKKEKVNL